MTKVVKMCDMDQRIALTVFKMLNGDRITIEKRPSETVIVTDVEPENLVYPEGWYYAKGSFRNKHTCTTSGYSEIYMERSDGCDWCSIAKYATIH